MEAVYKPTKKGRKLNVRAEPNATAEVVRQIDGGAQECFEVDRGWARLADGYADARFLVVREAEQADEPEPMPEEQPDAEEAAEQADEPEGRAALMKMTNAELRKLAEGSGISVPKGANKEEIVNAILADE